MIGCDLQNSSSCFRRLEWRMHTCCNSPRDWQMPKCLSDLFIHLQAGTDSSSSPKGSCILCWHPHQMTEIPAEFLGHTFLAWRSENDFKVFLQYLIYTRQQKWRKRDSLLNTSLKSVTKTVLTFVVFPDWSLISKSQKSTIEGKTKVFFQKQFSWKGHVIIVRRIYILCFSNLD